MNMQYPSGVVFFFSEYFMNLIYKKAFDFVNTIRFYKSFMNNKDS